MARNNQPLPPLWKEVLVTALCGVVGALFIYLFSIVVHAGIKDPKHATVASSCAAADKD